MNSVASNIRLHQKAQPNEHNRLEVFIQVWYLKGELQTVNMSRTSTKEIGITTPSKTILITQPFK